MSGASSSTTAAGCADLPAMPRMIKQAYCVLRGDLKQAAVPRMTAKAAGSRVASEAAGRSWVDPQGQMHLL